MASIELTDKSFAFKLHMAMYCVENNLNTSDFSKFCHDYFGLDFGPSTVKEKDVALSSVYYGLRSYLKENGITDVRDMTKEDIYKALNSPVAELQGRTVKEDYEAVIDNKAKEFLMKAHEVQKPIVMIGDLGRPEIDHILDRMRYSGVHEIQRMMNVPVKVLGAPEVDPEYLNLAYRRFETAERLERCANGICGLMLTTDSAALVFCPNPAVAAKMETLEKEFLRERGLPEPQIGGRAGVLNAMAEYRGIQQPEVLQEFVNSHGKYREDALAAVSNIVLSYNDQGMPIYACAADTCFKSLDGGFHNYPLLMMAGDAITVTGVNENNFASIGDNDAPIPEELTVLAVHDNEHGSVVITDAGVFVTGSVGQNLVDQFHILEQNKAMEQNQAQTIDENEIGRNI